MVFVLDKKKSPVMPCTEKRARQLLEQGKAVVHKMYPFTIRLKTQEDFCLQPLTLKIDPGSKVTGIAVLRGSEVILLIEIHHRTNIKTKLDKRRTLRKGRRSRKTRYRQPRFLNRKRQEGWLPPSLDARVNQVINAVNKLLKLLPITSISTEYAKFDTQLMQNATISGVEYQQGTLAGYEVREYLLEKWGRKCAYCGKEDVQLEVEHIIPKSRGGSNRISNLTLACRSCNLKKDNLTAKEFGYPEIQKQAKQPLRDAAMMNATRWKLYNQLKQFKLPVESTTGARTKKQRIEQKLPKTHYYDACCVGTTPEELTISQSYVQLWQATGRGNRQMCRTDKYGFPIAHRQNKKKHFGFQTGDTVRAIVPKGKHQGTHIGKALVRASGYFDIKHAGERICQGVSHKYMEVLQYANGWQYDKKLAG